MQARGLGAFADAGCGPRDGLEPNQQLLVVKLVIENPAVESVGQALYTPVNFDS